MGGLLQLLKEMGTVKLMAYGSAFLIIVLAFVFFLTKTGGQNLILLYGDLDLQDSNKIITELESKNIAYQLKANGSEILVPQEYVLKLRMSMAQSGIPSKGAIVGYEIFDNNDALGTSNFVQNVNLLRALEGELARTIGSFNNIQSARVHLVIPKKELFTREKQTPSASVILNIKGHSALTKEQINAISHLVATAVPGLDVNNITIVDTTGRSLKLGNKDEDSSAMMASTSEDYRVGFENRLKNTIESMLEQSIGIGHVKAQVSAEINFDRIVTNSEIYDPDGQVVRSVQEIDNKESSTDNENSDVSIANNLPNAPGAASNSSGPNATSNSQHNDTTTNYEISKTIKNHVSETGTVKKLSIAVLIDGTYLADRKTGTVTYVARTESELKQYEALIKSAVGFDAKRNDSFEIVNMQFTTDLSTMEVETSFSWLKKELPNIIQTLVIGVVVVLVLLLVIRPIAIRAFEATKTDIEETESVETAKALMGENGGDETSLEQGQEPLIDIAKIEARFKNNNSYKAVNDIVSKYPQETLTTLRKWMNKE